MSRLRLSRMPAQDLQSWAGQREARGESLVVDEGDRLLALALEVDGVEVGGVLLARRTDRVAGREEVSCEARAIETTLPATASGVWRAIAEGLVEQARRMGACRVRLAVDADLWPAFAEAGYRATMRTARGWIGPLVEERLRRDERIVLRAMSGPERRRFAEQARADLLAAMVRTGSGEASDARIAALDSALARVVGEDLDEHEWTLAAVAGEEVVGAMWGSVRPGAAAGAGVLQWQVATLERTERGRGLSPALLAAVVRRAEAAGIDRVDFRLWDHDGWGHWLTAMDAVTVLRVHGAAPVA